MLREHLHKEIDKIDIPKSEIFDAIDKGINRGRKGKIKNRKSKLKIFAAIVSAAAVILLTTIITLGFTIPSFAAKLPIIGSIYELFTENNEEFIFEEYGNHSAGLGLTKENNGVRVTITDAVYDKESITIAYTMESKEDLGEEPFLDGLFVAEEYKNSYTPGRFMTEQVSENEYAGVYVHYLMNGEKTDKVHINWDGERIRRSFDEEEPIEGKWSFEFTLDALEAETQEFGDLFSEGQGIKVKLIKMTTTPVSTNFYFSKVVDQNLKEWNEERGEFVSVDYLVSDNLGNEYNVLYNASYGNSKYAARERFSASLPDEEATSLIVTPEVNIYNDSELIKGPFRLEPIEVSLE